MHASGVCCMYIHIHLMELAYLIKDFMHREV